MIRRHERSRNKRIDIVRRMRRILGRIDDAVLGGRLKIVEFRLDGLFGRRRSRRGGGIDRHPVKLHPAHLGHVLLFIK